MATTDQYSTEYTDAYIDSPQDRLNTTQMHGKLRTAMFTHDQVGVGDAGSTVVLVKLPPGRVTVLLKESSAYINWTAASALMDFGWDAYTDRDGVAVAANPDGLLDNEDVDAAGAYDLGGSTPAIGVTAATGYMYTFNSLTGVVLRATSVTALADGDDIAGHITYVVA